MMFIGSKHCPRCGTAAAISESADTGKRNCPRCKRDMASLKIGSTLVRECERCFGLWLDVASFEQICADRGQQSAVLGAASLAPSNQVRREEKVNYVPCPMCGQLMNRINFARCSGVVVDFCKGHGTWFDRDELSRIVQFIREGGLEAARAREKEEIRLQRGSLRDEQFAASRRSGLLNSRDPEDPRIWGIASAGDLLKLLIDD
ncbi:MAG TPA: zf-TFIIB domain-containing protein [Pyrinomonadaceae bacterium]|nr:zf-TFIIB domain-containing protein [Pyrinomonadaceae bacterium]